MEIDYNQIKSGLLNNLSLRELQALCNIIEGESNIKIIHKRIKDALEPENAVDPIFCQQLQNKVDNKVFAMYDLITLSKAIIEKKYSLFNNDSNKGYK